MPTLRLFLVLVTLALAAAGCASDDPTGPPLPGGTTESEPNDFVAQSMGTLSSTDFVIPGSAAGPSDVDLYSVTASAAVNLHASLDWNGPSDLELSISNSNGVFIRHVDTAGHPEACTLGGLPAGTYTVRVGSFTSAPTSYTLTIGTR